MWSSCSIQTWMKTNSYNLKVLKFYLIVIDAIFSPEWKAQKWIMWPIITNITTVIVLSLCSTALTGGENTLCSIYLHRELTRSDSYPANSSSRDTFSSGGMLNTDWGRASFLCFFNTTGLGEEITATQEEEEEDDPLLTRRSPPNWPLKVELAYLGLVPPILLIYKSSSFVLFPLQQTKEGDKFDTKLHVKCVNSIWWCRTLTFFKEGNHFINNILELPIRPARKRDSLCFMSTQHTPDLEMYRCLKKTMPHSLSLHCHTSSTSIVCCILLLLWNLPVIQQGCQLSVNQKAQTY